MRKIERQVIEAVQAGREFSGGNTRVQVEGDRVSVFLHGSEIFRKFGEGSAAVEVFTLAGWSTPTTKSRLRALGVPLCTKNGTTLCAGVALDSEKVYTLAGGLVPGMFLSGPNGRKFGGA